MNDEDLKEALKEKAISIHIDNNGLHKQISGILVKDAESHLKICQIGCLVDNGFQLYFTTDTTHLTNPNYLAALMIMVTPGLYKAGDTVYLNRYGCIVGGRPNRHRVPMVWCVDETGNIYIAGMSNVDGEGAVRYTVFDVDNMRQFNNANNMTERIDESLKVIKNSNVFDHLLNIVGKGK